MGTSKLIKSIVLILVNVFFTSCIQSFIVPRKIKKQFTFCYDGKPTGLDTLININGYYEKLDIWWNNSGYGKTYNPRLDTNHINFIFFKDGICVYQFWWPDKTGKEYLEYIAKDKKYEVGGIYNGLYRVFGDTIKIQGINDCRWAMPTWMGDEIWYKIKDKNTLKFIGDKAMHNDNGFFYAKEDSLHNNIAHFIPVDTLPSSDIWLKKKKWFWCK